MSLLDRRVLIVLGKGGVGKTTVTAAIGLAAATSGRRALAVEVASQARLARLFSAGDSSGGEIPLYPGLAGLSLDPQKALEEYLLMALRVRALAERLAESRGLSYVTAAAPGLRELVTLGKVWHLTEQRTHGGAPRYELIVVDAPATGHAVGLLRTPRQYAEIARVGRVAAEAADIAALVEDRDRTGIVLVTTAEEIPVTETLETLERLAELGLEASCVVVNALYPDLLSDDDADALRRAGYLGDVGAAAVRAALSHVARRREQQAERDRLAAAAAVPIVELPFLFVPALDVDSVSELAAAVGAPFEELP